MNRFHLRHTTEFHYDGPVSESYNEVRLRPIQDERQSCISFRLVTTPNSRVTAHRDGLGNWVHQFSILPEHRRLLVETEAVVLTHEAAPGGTDLMTLAAFDLQREEISEEYFDFVAPSGYVPHLAGLGEIKQAAERLSGGTVVGFVNAASNQIHEEFQYVKGA